MNMLLRVRDNFYHKVRVYYTLNNLKFQKTKNPMRFSFPFVKSWHFDIFKRV